MKNRMTRCRGSGLLSGVVASVACYAAPSATQAEPNVARQWNEALLTAIRLDAPEPTVHACNLYHTSSAIYDAWSAYDSLSAGLFYTAKRSALDVESARREAISYAAYRALSARYQLSRDPVASHAIFDSVMASLGLDASLTSTAGDSPAALGNRIAAQILADTLDDGSNEANDYVDNTGYAAVNTPMVVDYPSVTNDVFEPLEDPNRWQPLHIESLTNQSGFPEPSSLQDYIGPHWGAVDTFAMGRNTSGPHSWSAIDPDLPPLLGGAVDAECRESSMLLIRYSNSLDPTKGPGAEVIDVSLCVSGNRSLGTHDGQGYALNPSTDAPYEDNFVKAADYGRVLAEFWADGPDSETRPGHWNVIAKYVSANPLLAKSIVGKRSYRQ